MYKRQGVGCAAIYGGNTGTTTTFSLENVAVRDNVIIKCREVGIEGTWQTVENNIIDVYKRQHLRLT